MLLAWIVDDYDPPSIIASFVAEDWLGARAPARRRFDNRDDARAWVESEAEAVHAHVKWIDACR